MGVHEEGQLKCEVHMLRAGEEAKFDAVCKILSVPGIYVLLHCLHKNIRTLACSGAVRKRISGTWSIICLQCLSALAVVSPRSICPEIRIQTGIPENLNRSEQNHFRIPDELFQRVRWKDPPKNCANTDEGIYLEEATLNKIIDTSSRIWVVMDYYWMWHVLSVRNI